MIDGEVTIESPEDAPINHHGYVSLALLALGTTIAVLYGNRNSTEDFLDSGAKRAVITDEGIEDFDRKEFLREPLE